MFLILAYIHITRRQVVSCCLYIWLIIFSVKHQRWKSLTLSPLKYVPFLQFFGEAFRVMSTVSRFSFSISLSSYAGFANPAIEWKRKHKTTQDPVSCYYIKNDSVRNYTLTNMHLPFKNYLTGRVHIQVTSYLYPNQRISCMLNLCHLFT